MTKFIRNQCDILKSRLAEQRKTIQVIAGPRQVGKSTMVDQVLQTLSVPYFSYNADTCRKHANAGTKADFQHLQAGLDETVV